MFNRPFLSRTLLILLSASTVALSTAQIISSGSSSNFDVYNNTGLLATGFEVTLGGISSAQVSAIYTSNLHYPVAQIVSNPGSITIRWSGAGTLPGQSSHFGFALTPDVDESLYPNFVDYQWTSGARFGAVVQPPRIWQYWDRILQRWRDIIRSLTGVGTEFSSDTFVIERRVTVLNTATLNMSDLRRGSTIWNSSPVIGISPLSPGGSLIYDFPATTSEFVVMSYDVKDVTGFVVASFMNTIKG